MPTENVSTNNAGAVSALKGYRAQFVYSLSRILSCREGEASFQPEGKFEDLDVYDEKGIVIEIVQVKNFGSTLTLSNIVTQASTSFLKRAVKAHAQGNFAKITLASFGSVNEDIKELATEQFSNRLKSKLKQFGLNDEQIEILREHFTYEIVHEDDLTKKAIEALQELKIFADTKISVELLVYWIYSTATEQIRIERNALQGQLLAIGKFQSDRVSFNRTYGTLIRPLTLNEHESDIKKLQADFYKGIAASFSHIQAGVDIIRPEKLEMVDLKFSQSNTVFIHGASGQGKSTVAYRYLHDYCEPHTAFVLSLPTDLATLYEVVNTLDAIAAGVMFSVTLYIDVVPGNSDWITVLQELASKKKLNFLITIREEDWNSIQIDDKFTYAELELGLDKVEAEIIYKSLNKFQVDLRFTDFQDVWDTFGESGPLLEFVYLVTQGESLPAKLKSQVNRIIDDDSGLAKDKIKLLRFVVLADCFGARVAYGDIARYLKLDNISRLTELLEREYLLKLSDGKTFIAGLHPVRSNLLRGFLFDPDIHDESEFALESLHFLDQSTVAAFLRHAFRYASLTPSALLKKLNGMKIDSWVVYDSVLRSLVWKGVSDFIDQNREVLQRALAKFGRGWIAVVNIDIAKALEGESITNILSLFSNEQRAEAENINSKLTGATEIYKHGVTWISGLKPISIDPVSEADFKGLASFVFWIERLKLGNVEISISTQSVETGFRKHTLEVLSRTLHAFKIYEQLNALNKIASDIFLDRFYRAHNVIKLSEPGEEIHCEYFFNFLDGEDYKSDDSFTHAKSVKIIDQLRFAFPDKEMYCTDGHGHKFSFVSGMPDESHTRIPRRSLLLDYLVEINSLFINLFEYETRFNTWEEYIDRVLERRALQVTILEKSITAFSLYHKKKTYGSLIEFVNQFRDVFAANLEKMAMPAFPKVLLDEWGLSGERNGEKGTPSNSAGKKHDLRKTLSLRRYEPYKKVYQEYDSSITNYLSQSVQTLTHLILARTGQNTDGTSDTSRVSLVGNLYKAYAIIEEFQRAFRTHFGKFTEPQLLDDLENRERSCVSALCFIYRHFVYSTSFLPGNILKTAHSHLDQVIESFLQKLSTELKVLGRELRSTFTVHRDTYERRLVILTKNDSSMIAHSTLERIYTVCHKILDKTDATSIKHAVLSKYFESMVVIPMVGDNSVNGKWYEFKLYNLIDKEFQELAQFNLIPHDIPETVRLQYAIHSWNSNLPDFVKLERMLGSITTASQLLFHFNQFLPFSGVELGQRGEEVLTEYLERVSTSIHENLQEGLDLFHYFRQACEDGKFIFESDHQKEEFEEYLQLTRLNFFPNDDDARQGGVERAIGAREMEQWLPRLQQLSENMGLVYLFLSDKIVSNHRQPKKP